MFDTGSVLNIDNCQGAVFIYLLNGFTFRGTINTKSTKANVQFGAAGTNPVVIETAFNGIVVAPETSITLATVATRHTGAFFAQSILARKNTTIVLSALQSSNFCTPSDACSSFCPCATGATKACTDNSSCETGSVCGSGNGAAFGLPTGTNVCWASICAATNGLGSQCQRVPQGCQADTDCASGQVCGVSNGAQFQFVSSRICWPSQCATDPAGTGCGTVQSPCGVCPSSCTPNCATKKCGDPQDDGCGGICVGYCNSGDSGCTSSAQCKTGSVCSQVAAAYYGKPAGQATCWPLTCEGRTLSQRNCGTATSVCGPQCPSNRANPYVFVTLPHGPSTCKPVRVGDLDNDGRSEIYVHFLNESNDLVLNRVDYQPGTNTWSKQVANFIIRTHYPSPPIRSPCTYCRPLLRRS
jgi:hypothetical protein